MRKRQFWGLAFILSRVQCFGSKAQDGERRRTCLEKKRETKIPTKGRKNVIV